VFYGKLQLLPLLCYSTGQAGKAED
jgi:hypothetical protein